MSSTSSNPSTTDKCHVVCACHSCGLRFFECEDPETPSKFGDSHHLPLGQRPIVVCEKCHFLKWQSHPHQPKDTETTLLDSKLPASPAPAPMIPQADAYPIHPAWVSPEAGHSSKQDTKIDPSSGGQSPSIRITNPYQKIQKKTDTTVVSTPVAKTKHSHSNESPGTSVEKNRKHTLEPEEKGEFEAKSIKLEETRICTRCDQPITTTNDRTLCIVWKHKGDVWQDRYTCCGRVESQPCFIGSHQPHQDALRYPKRKSQVEESKMAVRCHCPEIALFKRTHKPGPNLGRYFYRCNKCNFFRWADQVHGLSHPLESNLFCKSVDEAIPEMCLHADPWSEDQSNHQEPFNQRQRLLAACLIKEITIPVMGPPVKLAVLENEVIAHVRTIMQRGPEAIVEHLSPLSRMQIEARFGDFHVLFQDDQVVNYQECKDMLQAVLERNRVLHLTVTSTQRKDGHRVLHLKWLRNYLFL